MDVAIVLAGDEADVKSLTIRQKLYRRVKNCRRWSVLPKIIKINKISSFSHKNVLLNEKILYL